MRPQGGSRKGPLPEPWWTLDRGQDPGRQGSLRCWKVAGEGGGYASSGELTVTRPRVRVMGWERVIPAWVMSKLNFGRPEAERRRGSALAGSTPPERLSR